MSDAHSHQDDHSENHEGPIKTPKQLITAVVFGFVVPIIVIVLLVSFVTTDKRSAEGKALEPEAVARRIERVGHVEIAKAGAAQPAPVEAAPAPAAAMPAAVIPPADTMPAATAAAATPPALYASACAGCHASGAAGAPKVGDKAAWAPRLAQGIDGLTANAIKGKGIMPARGGSQGSDAEIKEVVTYMVNNSK